MADTRISALAAISSVAVGDQFAVAQAGSSFAATAGQLTTFMRMWTYLKVSSQHYGTSNTAFANIPGLSFVPGTNSSYEFEGQLMLKTSTATINPRIQVRWPTNTSSVVSINFAQTPTTQIMGFGHQVALVSTAVGGVTNTTGAWPCSLWGVIQTFGATASSFGLMHASESAGVFVSTCIGSFLKYRAY